jgi:DNA-binding transcriptional LysR family regulator
VDQLQSMRAFVAVARLQSYTRAADQLNISRAALSRSISELESHVGTRLLNRTTRKVSLADDAREYLDTCLRVIDMLDEAERHLNDDKVSECGPIRVIVHPLAVASGLSTVLDAFAATSSCVRLQVSVQDTPLNLVESGYDLSLYPEGLILNSTVVNRPLFSSKYVLAASAPYLRNTGPIRSICDLAQRRIVDGREGHVEHREGSALGEHDCAISLDDVHFRVSGSVARELALAGAGIAILPDIAIAHDSANLMRVDLDEPLNLGEISLGIQYQRAASLPRRLRTFIDACLSYFRAVGAVPSSRVALADMPRGAI